MSESENIKLRDRIVALEDELAQLRATVAGQSPHTDSASPVAASNAVQVPAEERLRAILASSVDFAIVGTDRNGIVTDWNVGAEHVFGFEASEMIGRSAEKIFTPEDRATGQIEREMREALARGHANDERWHVRKDGLRFWASGEMMPLLAENGTHLGYVKIVRDRTAEHRTGVALSEAAQSRQRIDRFHLALLELSDRLQHMTDPDSISQAAVEIIGVTLDLSIVGYGSIDAEAETITVEQEWNARSAASVRGTLHFRQFGTYIDDLKRGATVVISDVRTDPRTREHADILTAKHSASFVNMPVFERGAFVSMLFTGSDVPRLWNDDELAFLWQIAERVRLAGERCRSEQALRESESQFRAFAEAMPNQVWAARAGGEFYWFNRQAAAYFGAATEQSGRAADWFAYVHPEDQKKVRAAWSEALETGHNLQTECRIRRYDGVVRWFLIRAQPVRDADGQLAGWVGTNTDIDYQRQQARNLEELVAERTADRNALWQLSSDIMLRCTFQGVITAVNPAWEEVLGWRESELVGTNLFDLVHPEDLERTAEAAGALSQGFAHTRFDNRYRHRNGTYRWMSWSTRPGDDLINAVGRDITDETQQQIALRDSMDFTRLALSAVGGVGVWTYDMATDCFTCDAAISDLYAIDPEEGAAGIKRERFLANVHPEDRVRLRATMAGGLEHSGDLELEYRICHSNGSVRWVLSRGHTYFDDAGKPVRRTGVGVETTSQRQLEEQLRQSQKMEAVGQLTGGLAHDFNNMLTGITGSLDLLRIRIAQGRLSDVDRYVTAAQGAAKRAAALTHRLLAFSRRQTLDPKTTDVNRLVAGMEDLVRRTIGPAVELEVVALAGLWPTRVDPNQLENALLNLCINARDAMPDGGRLTIETCNRWMDARAARDRDLEPGQYISLCVSDTGQGMTADVIAKAFDPFFTTKPMGSGTGLGLSMTYGFARQSGGQVRIYSEPGEGAMVCIYLPRDNATVRADEPALALTDVPRAFDGEIVLVVDDEPAVRMLVTEVLSELGYQALEAGDGAAGLAILQSGIHVDLLITDVGLPGGMNGRQMADAARVGRPELKVLFITGYAENAVVRNGHLEAGMHVMTKPFAIDALASRIRDIIETEQ